MGWRVNWSVLTWNSEDGDHIYEKSGQTRRGARRLKGIYGERQASGSGNWEQDLINVSRAIR